MLGDCPPITSCMPENEPQFLASVKGVGSSLCLRARHRKQMKVLALMGLHSLWERYKITNKQNNKLHSTSDYKGSEGETTRRGVGRPVAVLGTAALRSWQQSQGLKEVRGKP